MPYDARYLALHDLANLVRRFDGRDPVADHTALRPVGGLSTRSSLSRFRAQGIDDLRARPPRAIVGHVDQTDQARGRATLTAALKSASATGGHRRIFTGMIFPAVACTEK